MLELCPLLVIKIAEVNAQYAHCFHAPLAQGARPHACELVPREHAERGSGQNYGAVAASPHKLWAQRPAPTRPSEAARPPAILRTWQRVRLSPHEIFGKQGQAGIHG